jgi:hypothetical protein
MQLIAMLTVAYFSVFTLVLGLCLTAAAGDRTQIVVDFDDRVASPLHIRAAA